MFKLSNILLDPAPPTGGGGSPPAAPAAPVSTGITQEALIAAIEKARSEEKSKLFDKISALEADVRRLGGASEAKDSEIKKLADANREFANTIQALTKATSTDGKTDTLKAIEEVTKQLKTQFEASLVSAVSAKEKETNERLAQLEKQNNQFSLERARTQIISELGGPDAVIDAMITGNTAEEIRTSALKSAEIRKQVLASAGVTVTTNTGQNQPGAQNGGGAPPPPALNPGGNPGGVGRQGAPTALQNVRRLTPKEYAANRGNIHSALVESAFVAGASR
jgi:hypothetical protein